MNIFEKYFFYLAIFLVPVFYVIVAGSFYLFFFVWKKNKYSRNKIQPATSINARLRKDIAYGAGALVIFGITGFFVFLTQQKGYGRIYSDPMKYGVAYLFFSVALMMLFHDAYFYWTHRLLHLNGWYQKIHSIHHHSTNPSPFTALSFHPAESLIQSAVLPLMIVIIPSHPYALCTFLFIMVYKNVKGHSGYEFTTPAYRQKKWNAINSFSIDHNRHHLHGKDNYGLYFTLWDRMMKTFKRE